MKRAIAAVVVLVLAVGGGLSWQFSCQSDEVRAPVKAAPTSPTPENEYRLVGRGGAVVEVPANWATNKTRCNSAAADTVIFDSGGVRLMCAIRQPRFSSVTISDYELVPPNVDLGELEFAMLDLKSPTGGPGTAYPEIGSVVRKGSTVTITKGH